MDKWNGYLNVQYDCFIKSEIFLFLQLSVQQSGFHLEVEKGILYEEKWKHYFISVSIKNDKNEIPEIFDEGYLCAYNPIVQTKGRKENVCKWDDDDFIDSIKWIVSNLENEAIS